MVLLRAGSVTADVDDRQTGLELTCSVGRLSNGRQAWGMLWFTVSLSSSSAECTLVASWGWRGVIDILNAYHAVRQGSLAVTSLVFCWDLTALTSVRSQAYLRMRCLQRDVRHAHLRGKLLQFLCGNLLTFGISSALGNSTGHKTQFSLHIGAGPQIFRFLPR
jgi:hypothetical protein